MKLEIRNSAKSQFPIEYVDINNIVIDIATNTISLHSKSKMRLFDIYVNGINRFVGKKKNNNTTLYHLVK